MVLKVASRLRVPCRYYAKSRKPHYTVLLSDLYEGTVIRKQNILCKENIREPVQYGGRHIVTLLPGAPPGAKLMSYVKDVYKEAHVPVDFEEILYEGSQDEKEFEDFEKRALTSLHRNGVGLKGNLLHPDSTQFSTNVVLRRELDLYVCVIHAKSYPHVKCKYPNLNMFICRQNTEGEYAMLEHEAKPGIIESLKIITEENTARFAQWCFEFALQQNRKKVTIVHKANIMKLSDGLFMKVVKDVARDYPQIEVNDMIVDNATMQLVQDPTQFDVVVTPNLYGNILSNIACGLIGGAGLMSGKNYGPSCALFEAGSRHLTFIDEDTLNPIAMLNASKDLLRYIGKPKHAELINQAIIKTLSMDKIQTNDIGGSNSSDEVVDSIKDNVRDLMKVAHLRSY